MTSALASNDALYRYLHRRDCSLSMAVAFLVAMLMLAPSLSPMSCWPILKTSTAMATIWYLAPRRPTCTSYSPAHVPVVPSLVVILAVSLIVSETGIFTELGV